MDICHGNRSNNGENLADSSKDSQYRNYSYKCDLTIHGLKETDPGTYYMSFTYRKGNSTFKSTIPPEFTVHVTGKYFISILYRERMKNTETDTCVFY